MNINDIDSDTIRFIGIIVVLFLAILSQRGKGQARSRGCLAGTGGFMGDALLILAFIYLAYPTDWLARWNSEAPKMEIEPPLDRIQEEVHYPPDTLPPREQDQFNFFAPDRQRRLNVKPRPMDTIPSLTGLYDPDIEEAIQADLEPRHFYLQLAASRSEASILKARRRYEDKLKREFHIAFDLEDPEFPYKLLAGPFVDKATAKQAIQGQKAWIRDIRKSPNLFFIEYP